MGRVGIAFLAFIALYFAIDAAAPRSLWRLFPEIGAMITGTWLLIRLLRMAANQAVWRLRNRLLVTYLFIAVVPILLILLLAATGGEFLVQQLAVYLVTSELDRRVENISAAVNSVERASSQDRPGVISGMINLFYLARYPGIELVLHEGSRTLRYPENSTEQGPNILWDDAQGVMTREGRFYLWAHKRTPWGDVTITAPLTREYLADLVPNLGMVDLLESSTNRTSTDTTQAGKIPAAVNRLDTEFSWYATIPVADWSQPGKERSGFLVVRSRTSAVRGAVFNRKTDLFQSSLQIVLVIGVIVFLIVEIISIVIGVALKRTLTG